MPAASCISNVENVYSNTLQIRVFDCVSVGDGAAKECCVGTTTISPRVSDFTIWDIIFGSTFHCANPPALIHKKVATNRQALLG